MSTAQLSPGAIVDGRFTIGAATWAREGAQSYAATDAQQGRPVVVTAYAPACFSSGLVLERCLRELRQLQTLQTPRVATVIACGKLPDGGIYEAVESLPDTRLDALVAGGALPGPQAASIIEQIGEGLLEAQKAGVIHRNLGPRVVFVGPEGAVVTGFSVGEPHGDKSFGPLDTSAPEQVEGKVVDQRTLIYNLAALMHMLITGAPLFPGDAATQLRAHLSAEIPADVHARLRRALGKDPRMRPMMLKQFLAELRAIGGGVARAPIAPSAGGADAPPMPGSNLGAPGGAAKPPGGSPTSRGWTMFMQGETPPAGAASPVAAAPAAQATADVPAKPKTRGWTMFMEGADEPEKKADDKPAAKPSTRGWTMFMEDEEGQAPPAEGESPVAQAVAPAPAPAPAGEAGAQPKTRGWTMFMEDEEAQAAPAPEPTVVAPAPMPVAAPPVGGEPAVKPSTRGWTMFMKDDEQAEAVAIAQPAAQAPDEPETKIFMVSPPPAAAPPVAAPPAAAPVAGASTPKSRGWTMFTEASDDEATQAVSMATPVEAVAAPAPAPAPEPAEAEAEAEPSSDSSSTAMGRRGDSDAPSKKRGWTMFMEKPLDKGTDPLGGVAPSSGESNAKGWTVFSPAADVTGQSAADPAQLAMDEPAAASSPSYEQELAPARDAGSLTAAGQTHVEDDRVAARAQQAAEDDRMKARTVVVTGPPDPSLANNRLNTIVAPHSPAAPPRMVTIVNPEQSMASLAAAGNDPLSGPVGSVNTTMPGAVSGPISTGMTGPISTGISGPISTGMAAPSSTSMPVHRGSHAMEPAKKGSPVVLIVVGLVLVAAAIAAAFVLLD